MSHAIDMHCHFWPAEFLRDIHAGREHFGWSAHPGQDGAYVLTGGPHPVRAQLPIRDLVDFNARIDARIADQGIGMEAVMISGFLWNYHLSRAESTAFARAVNDELADVERHSHFHVGLAHLPLPHTGAAVDEVERCVKDLGLTHFGLGTVFDGRNYDHPDIVPVIDAIAEAGGTISTHPVYFDTIGTPSRLTSPLLKGGLASPIEAGMSMATIVTSGVLDRFPEFRVWVSHGGGAAMYAMGRLDRRWGAMPAEGRPTAQTPSDYLRRFWYGNLVHGDRHLRFLIDMVGADRVTIGTDHPFQWDHLGGSANWIRSTDVLTAEDRDALLWQNAATFLDAQPPWSTAE